MNFDYREAAKKNILVVAHRGVSAGNIPCNTLPAYEIALKAGATSMISPKIVPLDSEPYKMSIYIAFVKGPDGEQIEFFKQVK